MFIFVCLNFRNNSCYRWFGLLILSPFVRGSFCRIAGYVNLQWLWLYFSRKSRNLLLASTSQIYKIYIIFRTPTLSSLSRIIFYYFGITTEMFYVIYFNLLNQVIKSKYHHYDDNSLSEIFLAGVTS